MIKDILKPKPIDNIIDDLLRPSYVKNDANTILSLIDKKEILIPIVEHESFKSRIILEQLFSKCCTDDRHIELTKIIMKKQLIDLSDNNNRFLRVAYHHNSFDTIRLLLNQESVKSKLTVIQKRALRAYILIGQEPLIDKPTATRLIFESDI